MENIPFGGKWDGGDVNVVTAPSSFWTQHKKPDNGYLLGSRIEAGEQTYFSSLFSFVFLKMHYYFMINSRLKLF